jgi:hypothetical protein
VTFLPNDFPFSEYTLSDEHTPWWGEEKVRLLSFYCMCHYYLDFFSDFSKVITATFDFKMHNQSKTMYVL